MAKMKDFLMNVEELAWEAIEAGADSASEIYAYVYMFDRRVDKATVEDVVSRLYLKELDKPDNIFYN